MSDIGVEVFRDDKKVYDEKKNQEDNKKEIFYSVGDKISSDLPQLENELVYSEKLNEGLTFVAS